MSKCYEHLWFSTEQKKTQLLIFTCEHDEFVDHLTSGLNKLQFFRNIQSILQRFMEITKRIITSMAFLVLMIYNRFLDNIYNKHEEVEICKHTSCLRAQLESVSHYRKNATRANKYNYWFFIYLKTIIEINFGIEKSNSVFRGIDSIIAG